MSRIVETPAILGQILRKTANHKFTIFDHFKEDVYSVGITVAVKSEQHMVLFCSYQRLMPQGHLRLRTFCNRSRDNCRPSKS
jgi:hypothetical protein